MFLEEGNMDEGIATPLKSVPNKPRLYVQNTQSLWIEHYQEWWPFTPDAIELFHLRNTKGVRALC